MSTRLFYLKRASNNGSTRAELDLKQNTLFSREQLKLSQFTCHSFVGVMCVMLVLPGFTITINSKLCNNGLFLHIFIMTLSPLESCRVIFDTCFTQIKARQIEDDHKYISLQMYLHICSKTVMDF